jgi:hypothetical protein
MKKELRELFKDELRELELLEQAFQERRNELLKKIEAERNKVNLINEGYNKYPHLFAKE